MLKQYCIYTRDFAQCKGVFRDLQQYHIPYEPHINRTRFWLDSTNKEHHVFYLQYRNYMVCVDHEHNHATGV